MVGTAPLALLLLLGPAPVLGVHIGGSSAAISMELHTSQANGTGTDEELGRAHCCSCLDNSSGKVHIELPTSTKFLGFDCARCRPDQGCRSLPIAAAACNGEGFAAKVKETIGPKGEAVFALKTAATWLEYCHARPKGEHFVDFVQAATNQREQQALLPAQPTGKNGETEKRLHIERKELTSANSPEQTEKRLHIEQKELTSANSPEQAREKEPYTEEKKKPPMTLEEYNLHINNLLEEEAKKDFEEEAKKQKLKDEEELAKKFTVEKCGPSFWRKFSSNFEPEWDAGPNDAQVDPRKWVEDHPLPCNLVRECGLAFDWAEPDTKPSCQVYADAHMSCRKFIAGLFEGGEVPDFKVKYMGPVLEMFKKMTRLAERAKEFEEAAARKPDQKRCNMKVKNFNTFTSSDRFEDDDNSKCDALPKAFSFCVGKTLRWKDAQKAKALEAQVVKFLARWPTCD